jgi:hypothetical protein
LNLLVFLPSLHKTSKWKSEQRRREPPVPCDATGSAFRPVTFQKVRERRDMGA